MKPITCADGVNLLVDYLEGVLPADVVAAVDAHVAQCPRCVAFVASYRETPRIFREAMAATLPDDMAAALLEFLRNKRTEPS